jgi:hypothetical protein
MVKCMCFARELSLILAKLFGLLGRFIDGIFRYRILLSVLLGIGYFNEGYL